MTDPPQEPSPRISTFVTSRDDVEAGAEEDDAARRSGTVPRLLLLGVVPVAALVVFLAFATRGCACPPDPPIPMSPVVGTVVTFDPPGAARGFELRVNGYSHRLELGQLDDPTAFPPAHLADHLGSGQPVRAFYVLADGVPTVYRLEDTPPT